MYGLTNRDTNRLMDGGMDGGMNGDLYQFNFPVMGIVFLGHSFFVSILVFLVTPAAKVTR